MEKEKSAAGPGVLEVPGEEAGGKSLSLMAELAEEIRDSTHIQESDRKALCEQLAKGRGEWSSR